MADENKKLFDYSKREIVEYYVTKLNSRTVAILILIGVWFFLSLLFNINYYKFDQETHTLEWLTSTVIQAVATLTGLVAVIHVFMIRILIEDREKMNEEEKKEIQNNKIHKRGNAFRKVFLSLSLLFL